MHAAVVHAEAQPDAMLPIERALLAEAGATLICADSTDTDTIIAAAHTADILLSEFAPISRRLLEGLPRCQAVVCYAIGLDHVDLAAATELGIIVAHTPGFCADEVSTHALMFLLACARRLLPLDRRLRAGWWPDGQRLEAELLPMGALRGERLGLVGFGSIARLVAQKAQAFGLVVSACDPLAPDTAFAAAGVARLELDQLLVTSDYVSLHAPLLPATRHMLGAAQLAQMKSSAFLINTSRGALVDEAALVTALRSGQIAGAALDVFVHEPPAPDHPLLQLENVIVTPHSAYCSNAAYTRVRHMAAEAAAQVLRGEWPAAVGNPQVRGRSRMERQGGRS
ncbi:MAG: C-terminal binding protein [Chloroflexota bacterium]|nr:C-terminal binding protein [Chloroflexota bacterium]